MSSKSIALGVILLSCILTLWPKSAAAVPSAAEAKRQVKKVRKSESQTCAQEQRTAVFLQIQETIDKGGCYVKFFPVDCKLKHDQNDELLTYLKSKGYIIRPGFNDPERDSFIDWCEVSKRGEAVDAN